MTNFDTIDLKKVDADTTRGGNQAFHLVSNFTGEAGELMLDFQAGPNRTLLRGDVDGDGAADLTVVLSGGNYTGFTGFVL